MSPYLVIICLCIWLIGCVSFSSDVSPAPSFPVPDPDLPKLTHLSKARPRSQKQHASRRPIVGSESLLIENVAGRDDALEVFFGGENSDVKRSVSPKQRKPVACPRRFSIVSSFY